MHHATLIPLRPHRIPPSPKSSLQFLSSHPPYRLGPAARLCPVTLCLPCPLAPPRRIYTTIRNRKCRPPVAAFIAPSHLRSTTAAGLALVTPDHHILQPQQPRVHAHHHLTQPTHPHALPRSRSSAPPPLPVPRTSIRLLLAPSW